jgi:hypothetical protein
MYNFIKFLECNFVNSLGCKGKCRERKKGGDRIGGKLAG